MALVRLVETDEVPSEVQAVYQSGEQQYGQVLNTWRALGHKPEVFQAYLPFLRSIFGPGTLSQRIKDLVAVRIGILNHCRYSTSHRVASARAQGIREEDLIGLLEPDAYAFSPTEKVALAYTDELTTQVGQVSFADNAQAVSPELLVQVKEHFNDTEIVELTLTIGVWNWLSRFHRVMDFELDMPAPPAEIDDAL